MASSEEESLNTYASQLDALDERLAACCDASDEPLHILQYNEEASATLRRRLNLLPTQNGALGKPAVLECLTSRVVPRVTQLLKQLTILYRDGRGSLPLLHTTISTGPQGGAVAQWGLEEGWPAVHAVVPTVMAVRLISGIRSASLALVAPSAFSSDPQLSRLRTQLTEQLLSQDTLSALAAACRFVKEQGWPAGDLVTMQQQHEQQQVPQGGAEGDADSSSDKPGKRWRKLNDGGMLVERNATGGSRYDCYQDGLTLANSVLDVLCAQVDSLLRQKQLRPSDTALRAAAGRLMANVRETGVVERVAAMVLAAPPASVLIARTATGADPDGDLTGLVALQFNAMGLLKKLSDMRDLAGHEPIRALLEGQEVLRLRRALLQQLAAWRPEAGGGKGVPDEDVDAAAGGGRAGGAEQEAEWEADEEEGAGGREQGEMWAALRRGALRKAMGATLQVSQVMRMMVGAVCRYGRGPACVLGSRGSHDYRLQDGDWEGKGMEARYQGKGHRGLVWTQHLPRARVSTFGSHVHDRGVGERGPRMPYSSYFAQSIPASLLQPTSRISSSYGSASILHPAGGGRRLRLHLQCTRGGVVPGHARAVAFPGGGGGAGAPRLPRAVPPRGGHGAAGGAGRRPAHQGPHASR